MNGPLFVSYARERTDFVRWLAAELESVGLPVWRDVEDLRVGAEWHGDLVAALDGCACLLLVLVRWSIGSTWVAREWRHVLARGIPVLPLLLEDCEIPPDLRHLHCLEFSREEWREESLRRLKKRLHEFAYVLPPPRLLDVLDRVSWQEVSGAWGYVIEESTDESFREVKEHQSDRRGAIGGYLRLHVGKNIHSDRYFRAKAVSGDRTCVQDSDWGETLKFPRDTWAEEMLREMEQAKANEPQNRGCHWFVGAVAVTALAIALLRWLS